MVDQFQEKKKNQNPVCSTTQTVYFKVFSVSKQILREAIWCNYRTAAYNFG